MNNQIIYIHKAALERSRDYKHAECALIDIIIKVDQNKVYRHYAYKSLFDYVTRYLGLSEAVAFNFITVSRKSVLVPELRQAINNGEITLTKARKITPVITPQNQTTWLDMAKNLPQPQFEKELAKANPKLATLERVTYKTERRLSVSFGVEEEVYEKFKKVKDIVSQKKRHSAGLEEVFEEMVTLYLEKHDPLEKAKRAKCRAEKGEQVTDGKMANFKMTLEKMKDVEIEDLKRESAEKTLELSPKPGLNLESKLELGQAPKQTSAQTPDQKAHPSPVLNTGKVAGTGSSSMRIKIPAHINHALMIRDQNQCTQIDKNGKRCGDKRWLEVHHIKPIKNGGTNTLSNLKLLCSGHHKLEHM